jgi:hypothetical protein
MQEHHNVGVKTGLLPQGQVQIEAGENGGAKVTRMSIFTRRQNTMNLPVSPERVREYYAGGRGLVQDVFPELGADEREFLMSGATPAEWDDIFGSSEDEEDPV